MKRIIRRSVFETNSSSSHTLSLIGEPKIKTPTIITDNEYITIHTGEYGWGYEVLDTFEERLSYLVTCRIGNFDYDNEDEDLREYIEADEVLSEIDKLLKEKYNLKLNIRSEDCIYSPYGYIDHQSVGEIEGVIFEEYRNGNKTIRECLEKYLFTDNLKVVIDNDNSCYFEGEGEKEAYQYFGSDIDNSWRFDEY